MKNFSSLAVLLLYLLWKPTTQFKKGAIMLKFESVQIPQKVNACYWYANGSLEQTKYDLKFRFGLFLIGSKIIGLESILVSSTNPGKYEISPQTVDFVHVHKFDQQNGWRRSVDIYCTQLEDDTIMDSNRMDGLTVIGGKGVYKVDCRPCHGSGRNTLFYGIVKTLSADLSTPYRHVTFHFFNTTLDEREETDRGCAWNDYYMDVNQNTGFINSPFREYTVASAFKYHEFDWKYTLLGANFQPSLVVNGLTRSYSTVSNVINTVFVMNTEKEFLQGKCNLEWIEGHFPLFKPYKAGIQSTMKPMRQLWNSQVLYYVASSGYVSVENQTFMCNLDVNDKACRSSSTAVCANSFRSGSNCDEDVSICGKSNQCKHGAVCTGDDTTALCICPELTYGEFCQFFNCSMSCTNGRCTGPNICSDCDPGWSGDNCELPTCESYSKCVNGDCIIKHGNRTCECKSSRFGGEACEIECPEKCEHGVCGLINTIPTCLCEQGFSGDHCAAPPMAERPVLKASKAFIIKISVYIAVVCIAIIASYIVIEMRVSVSRFSIFKIMDTKIVRDKMRELRKAALSRNISVSAHLVNPVHSSRPSQNLENKKLTMLESVQTNIYENDNLNLNVDLEQNEPKQSVFIEPIPPDSPKNDQNSKSSDRKTPESTDLDQYYTYLDNNVLQ